MRYRVLKRHFTTSEAYDEGERRDMAEEEARPLLAMGVLEPWDAPKAEDASDAPKTAARKSGAKD